MTRILVLVLMAAMAMTRTAVAQQSPDDIVWIQVEAQPGLSKALDRARNYAGNLEDVNGFSLGGNWFGIVLGPYRRADAETALDVYRARGRIPDDSFITLARSFGAQFWPEGADVLSRGTLATPDVATDATAQTATVAIQPEPADETRAQARASERLLSATEKRALQVALKAAGFYASAIDGAFGAGTRRSMAAWQRENNFDDTGILTTRQRQMLMDQYNAPLISVGMAPVSDGKAGIQMQMPTKEVGFTRYEPPFAHYDNRNGGDIRVLLISQPGNRATLYGLYDIMQTLEIVPLEGPRQRKKNSFTLEGRNGRIVSYTEAVLKDGEIKGFTLIWPTGDETRRTRVLAAMRDSFARLPGVLDPAAGGDTEQNIDLVAGLEIRKPKLSRSGFFVDARGTVVTTAEAVSGCTRITLDQDYTADLLSTDDRLGVAILRPAKALAPSVIAAFRQTEPRLKSSVAVSGYSFEGALGAPSLTFGRIEDVRGLDGRSDLRRLTLDALPGDAGGPVLDDAGGVVGMLLPASKSARKLPDGVGFAAGAGAIAKLLEAAGLSIGAATDTARMTPDGLSRRAAGMTVLVSCWE